MNSTGVLVIIGFAEALSAPEVVWSLADEGAKIVAFTRRGARSALRSSRYVSLIEITPPETSCAQALADLTAQISLLKAAHPQSRFALMPLDDGAVWLLSHAPGIPDMPIVGPTNERAVLALNKWAQIDCARKAGFAVPETFMVEKAGEVLEKALDFPVVFKPVWASREKNGRLTRGPAWTCVDRVELEAAVKSWGEREPMLLQHFVCGVGEGLFGLAAGEGVIGWSGHRRLRMMNPQGSGSSACVSREVDQALKEAGERFITLSDWRGLFMIELLRDQSGKVWFMELNGRAWGSMALARRMGFEYPAWAVRKILNPEARVVLPPPAGRPLVCRHLGRELVHLLFVMRGPKSKAPTPWPSRWRAAREVLSFNRDDRWYNWRSDDRNVFLSDAIGTVKGQLFKAKGPQ
ncbi:MAG TPA: hypothetical protein VMR33_11860 [Candidatus Baltobacteraceae bacterium]|jgi:hypothetical protein|nr:hypothetical protein [Candidatus Baltobacteraceae bacterium]